MANFGNKNYGLAHFFGLVAQTAQKERNPISHMLGLVRRVRPNYNSPELSLEQYAHNVFRVPGHVVGGTFEHAYAQADSRGYFHYRTPGGIEDVFPF